MQESGKPKGVIVPIVTPYKTDQAKQIDYKVFSEHLNFLVEEEVDGIFLLGTNGEASLLTWEERKSLVEFVTERLAQEVDLYVGTGFPGFQETVDFSQFVQGKEADFLVVCLPFFIAYHSEKSSITIAN